MKTSPFSPWTDEAPPTPPDTSADLLQQAAAQLSEAATRLAALEPSGSAPSLQITVITPLGDPLPFTIDAGPDLSLLS